MIRKVVAPAAALVLLGGGGFAYAAWQPASTPTTLVLTTVSVPPGTRPTAARDGTLTWPSITVDGQAVQLYRVTRHGGGADAEVCAVPEPSCVDTAVPVGVWTYSVRPVFHGWTGESGPESLPVTVTPAAAAAAGAAASASDAAPVGGLAGPDGSGPPASVGTPPTAVGDDSPGQGPGPVAPTAGTPPVPAPVPGGTSPDISDLPEEPDLSDATPTDDGVDPGPSLSDDSSPLSDPDHPA